MPDLSCAAEAISSARALVIGAGAGMGVDSGLPDFRGDEGFWNAYPPYRHLGVSFVDMADPRWFRDDPTFAWGFYGHRRNLYRDTVPHAGFAILQSWADATPDGAFVFTSNVDHQFQRAGFSETAVYECHGTIEWSQCTRPCGALFRASLDRLDVDPQTMRVPAEQLPRCPDCGALARPNILMFGDSQWDSSHSAAQSSRLERWLDDTRGPRVVIECGAGTAVPSVRWFCERVLGPEDLLIRINPREPDAPAGAISCPASALETLQAIDALIGA